MRASESFKIFERNSSFSFLIRLKKITFVSIKVFLKYNNYQEIILRCRYLSTVKRWQSNHLVIHFASFVFYAPEGFQERTDANLRTREFTTFGEEDAHRFSSFLMQNSLRRRGIFPTTKNNKTYDPPARVMSVNQFCKSLVSQHTFRVYFFFSFFF